MHHEILIMHFKIIIFLTFICFLFLGCSIVPDQLKTTEGIVETHPDSALSILQHLKPEIYKSSSNRALYGLLLYHALESTDRNILPDSIIDFSINYYQNHNDNIHLAGCYFYKGHMFKHALRNDEAANVYIKALNCLQNTNEYVLLGKIYSDIGDICSMQTDNKEALKKYKYSLYYFNLAGNKINAKFILISIGKSYRFLKNYKIAQRYYQQAIYNSKDSLLYGAAYQEIGLNYYSLKQFDSAQYYLRKSLKFPFRGNSYSIRCITLSDLLLFFSFSSEVTNRCNVLSSKKLSGLLMTIF